MVLAHDAPASRGETPEPTASLALARCRSWIRCRWRISPVSFVRLDQELACDAEVMALLSHRSGARYAEALLKTQIAATPLPLGCYWPARAAHPLEERIAMLKNPLRSAGRRRPWPRRHDRALSRPAASPSLGKPAAQPVVAKVATFSELPIAATPAPRLTAAPATPAAPQATPDANATGDWIGSLKSPDLRLAIHDGATIPPGALARTLDGTTQNTYGMLIDPGDCLERRAIVQRPEGSKGGYSRQEVGSKRPPQPWIGNMVTGRNRRGR